jgi:IS5 family transposase
MLRIHLLQQWYALSDPAMEEALCDTLVKRQLTQLIRLDQTPDETTTLNFRHLLEKHQLAAAMHKQINMHLARKDMSLRAGTIIDATIINTPSSTKNGDGEPDPEMQQTENGDQ